MRIAVFLLNFACYFAKKCVKMRLKVIMFKQIISDLASEGGNGGEV